MEMSLFPLKTVLFPRAHLPLHIFEERYKEMINGCLDRDERFGVVLIRSGEEVGESAQTFEVGTSARIIHSRTLGDGQLSIICIGEQRFRIVDIHHNQPFLVGDVQLLDSNRENEQLLPHLTDTATTLFAEYYRLCLNLSGQWAKSVNIPSEADFVADLVASKLAISSTKKQQLLETLTIHKRLEIEIELLQKGVRQLRQSLAAARSQKHYGLSALG